MILNHVKFCKVFLPEALILNEITFSESKSESSRAVGE